MTKDSLTKRVFGLIYCYQAHTTQLFTRNLRLYQVHYSSIDHLLPWSIERSSITISLANTTPVLSCLPRPVAGLNL